MKPEHIEALSALFDGEPVDPSLLEEALGDPAAADTLAVFASLRVLAQNERGEPGGAFYAGVEALLERRGFAARLARTLLPAVAAILIVTAGAIGYVLGGAMEPPTVMSLARPAAAPWPRSTPDVGIAALPRPLRPDAAHVNVPMRILAAREEPSGPPVAGLRLRFQTWQDQAGGARPPQARPGRVPASATTVAEPSPWDGPQPTAESAVATESRIR